MTLPRSYNVDADLILISNTVEARVVAARLRSVRKPVVVLDFLLFDDMEMASTAGGSFKTAQIRVIDGDHLMANDPADPVLTVYRQATLMGYATAATLPGSAERVAVTAADASRVVIFGFAAGAAMDGGFTAPARRVGYHVTNARQLNATGWAMFDAMIQWARPSGSSAGSGDLSWNLAGARHRGARLRPLANHMDAEPRARRLAGDRLGRLRGPEPGTEHQEARDHVRAHLRQPGRSCRW